jgi:hypothetical protein
MDSPSRKNKMIIRDGPFQGRKALLTTTLEGDWVRIEGEESEVEFRVGKDDKIIFPIDYDERDLRHVYDLLQKREQA